MQAIRILSCRASRSLCLGLCGLALWVAAQAQQGPQALPSGTASATQGIPPVLNRPRIGLVLSGGGARGLAHVGVLKVL